MKQVILFLTILSFGLFLMTGCEKNTTSVTNDLPDDQALSLELSKDDGSTLSDYLVDWGIDDGDEDNMYDGFSTFSPSISFPKIMSPINNVVRFGRKIFHRYPRRIVLVRVAPDTILFNIERVLDGRFFIFEKIGGDSTQPDTIVIHRKPLRHTVSRSAIFVRRTPAVAANEVGFRSWKLDKITLSKGYSRPVHTVEIHKITITTSSGDTTTFVNPLHTFLNIPEDIPTFVRGDSVTITALVSNSSDSLVYNPVTGATETVLLHYGISPRHHARRRFQFKGVDPITGYNIYEGSWKIHEPANRPFHAVVDVIDNGTIYDDDAQAYPYNSTTWGCPYRVVLSK